MRKLLILVAILLPLTTSTLAEVPKVINYQAKLTDADGVALNGDYDITFSIWDDATGGTRVWGPETHSSVTVTNGLFDVQLGTITTLGIDFSDSLWVEVEVEGVTLGPREKLGTVPYAFRAIYADTAEYAESSTGDNDWQISGDGTAPDTVYNLNDYVGIGTASPSDKLHVHNGDIRLSRTTESSNSIKFYGGIGYISNELNSPLCFETNSLTRMTITGAGDVGIGTTSPQSKLAVEGRSIGFCDGKNRICFHPASAEGYTWHMYIDAYYDGEWHEIASNDNTDGSNWCCAETKYPGPYRVRGSRNTDTYGRHLYAVFNGVAAKKTNKIADWIPSPFTYEYDPKENVIRFPQNIGGGSGDGAWISYYRQTRSGEDTRLRIATLGDDNDDLMLEGGGGGYIDIVNGNVGIGTTSPSQKLDVNGYIKGTGVCIGDDCRTSWPTGTVSGSGTSGYIAKWTSGSAIGSSAIYQSGSNVGIGTTLPGKKLDVSGEIRSSGNMYENTDMRVTSCKCLTLSTGSAELDITGMCDGIKGCTMTLNTFNAVATGAFTSFKGSGLDKWTSVYIRHYEWGSPSGPQIRGAQGTNGDGGVIIEAYPGGSYVTSYTASSTGCGKVKLHVMGGWTTHFCICKLE